MASESFTTSGGCYDAVTKRGRLHDNVHLLSLPFEILQHLLLFCTTPSFFQILGTCKRLFQLAGSSRAVLIHHLDQVPGITLGLRDPTIHTHDLFLTLRRRGAAHLVGFSIKADCTNLHAEYGIIDPNASGMAEGVIALALRESSRLRLYDVEGVSCKLTDVIPSIFDNGVGKIWKTVPSCGTVFILFSQSRYFGQDEDHTPKQVPSWCRTIEEGSNYKWNAALDIGLTSLRLDETFYYISREDKSLSGNTYGHPIQIPAATPWLGRILVPTDFVVSSSWEYAVLWDLPGSIAPSMFAQVIVYTHQKSSPSDIQGDTPGETYYRADRVWPVRDRPEESRLSRLPRKTPSLHRPHSLQSSVPPQLESLPECIARALKDSYIPSAPRSIAFAEQDRRLMMFTPGNIVPYDVAYASSSRSRENASPDSEEADPFGNSRTPWTRRLHHVTWNLTTPFYSRHVTETELRTDGDVSWLVRACRVSYLSLATAKVPRGECRNDKLGTEVLCVMSAETSLTHDQCSHRTDKSQCVNSNLNDVKVVARLWGWQPSDSSLVGEQNVVCCDTRVAIAEWDKIFIWSVDPKALIEEAVDHDLTSPADISSPENLSDSVPQRGEIRRDPAWTYAKIYDVNMEAWYVELKPIVLSATEGMGISGGRIMAGSGKAVVIRQLMWNDPNTLVVRTDRGLQIWNLGPSASGERCEETLEMDQPELPQHRDFDDRKED